MKRPPHESIVSSFSRSILAALFMAVLFLASRPAAAQCNPSLDPACGETPGVGPDVGISPDGGEYTSQSPGGITVPVTIVFTDPEKLNGATLQVRLWKGGSYVPVSMTWSTRFDGVVGTATGNIQLTGAGDSILVAQVANNLGVVGSSRATFRLTVPDPAAPIVSLEPHHSNFHDASQGALVLDYPLASYKSMGVQRTVALLHNSDLARPAAFVQVDARPGYGDTSQVTTMSLRLERWTSGATGTQPLLLPEIFYKRVDGMQRLGIYWTWAAQQQTGGPKMWAVVRAYRADGIYTETRNLIRVPVINENTSRYGAGWIIAGVKRLYVSGVDGTVSLSEGNGILRIFENPCGTSTADCTYTTPAGDFSRLTYRASSATWVRTYSDGSQETFVKSGTVHGLMTSVSNRFGNATTVEWQNAQDGTNTPVVARIVDPAGQATTFTYDANWYLKSVTALGRTINCTIDGAKQLADIAGPPNLRLTYDANRMIASYNWSFNAGSLREPGVTTDVAYNDNMRLKSITGAAITVSSGLWGRPQVQYKSAENAVAPEAWWNVAASRSTPAEAVLSDAVFVQVTDAGGHVTRMAFDRYGNPTKVIDASSETTTMKWTADGLLDYADSALQFVKNVWNSKGQLVQRTVNGAAVYEASYNLDGLPEFELSGQEGNWFEYGSQNEVVRTWYGKREDRLRNGTTYTYNTRFQVLSTTDPKGRKTEWDYEGNAWKNPDYVRAVRDDGIIVRTNYTYDSRSRLRTVSNTLGETRTVDYDDHNRPIRTVDALSRAALYEYTGANLTKFTDPGGRTYTFTYNALGWRESEQSSGQTGSRTFRYDLEGHIVSETDRRGLTVTASFDAVHRPLTRVADGQQTTFSYPDAFTQLVTNNESSVTVKRIADVGTIDSVTTTLAGRTFEVKPLYDVDDAYQAKGLDLKTFANGSLLRTSSIRYALQRQPVNGAPGFTYAVTDVAGRTSTMEFDTAGRPVRTYFPNGVTQTRAFSNDGRLDGSSFSSSAVNQKLGATFSYDFLNRLNTRTSSTDDRYWAYAYDALGQVTRYGGYTNPGENCGTACNVSKIREEEYTYDPSGNRTDRGGVLVSGTNRYAQFNGFTFEYDAEGNITRKYKTGFDQRFTWNTLGQLTSVTTNGAAVSYGYNGLNRRVRRTQSGVSRYFLYNDDDILLEVDQNGDPVRTYTHWPGTDTPLAVRVTNAGVNSDYYYTLEEPGHVTGLLNAAGGVAAEYHYTAWGEVESATDPTGQPLRYMGREIDATTGLYYVRARWYDASMGRFLSQDPIGLRGGANTYAYAGNDPVNGRDPSGLNPCGKGGTGPGDLCRVYVMMWKLSQKLGANGVEESSDDVEDPADRTWEPTQEDEYEKFFRDLYGQTSWLNDYTLFWAKVYSFFPWGSGLQAFRFGKGTTAIGRIDDVDAFVRANPGTRFGRWKNWDSMTGAERLQAERAFIDRAIRRGDTIVLVADDYGMWTEIELFFISLRNGKVVMP